MRLDVMRGIINILSIFINRVPGKATKLTVRLLISGWANFTAMPMIKPSTTEVMVNSN